MDDIADFMADDLALEDFQLEPRMREREDGYKLPPDCSRFILPIALIKALAKHPLSRELYPSSAGFYPRDPRSYDCGSLPYDLIYYCVSGAMTLRIGAANWPVSSGDLLVLPSGQAHVTESSRMTPWTYFWVTYAGERHQDFTRFLNVSRPVTPLGLHPELIAVFEALCALRTSDFALDTFVGGANHLKSLLARISLTHSRSDKGRKGRINLDRIRRFMAAHLDASLTLDEMAQTCSLSPFHFAHSFKQLTGLPPMQYFIQLRIQHACHLLSATRDPIKLVASKVGYEDTRYFSRTFLRVIGMTPQAYRRWNERGI